MNTPHRLHSFAISIHGEIHDDEDGHMVRLAAVNLTPRLAGKLTPTEQRLISAALQVAGAPLADRKRLV